MAKRGKLNKAKTKDEDIRPFRPRRYETFILIVCEDKSTEPYYFRQFKQLFPEETVYLREIGTGKKPKGIVEQAVKERDSLSAEARKEIDEVWVVFDKDDEGNNQTTLASFNTAWELAEKENIKIAFSNEVFELWLLLHFGDVSSANPIPRADIFSRLGNAIASFESYKSFIYNHKKADPEGVIGAVSVYGNEEKAIQRAEKLLIEQINKKPIEANPSTRVHFLVKRLRELIEWHSSFPIKA
ncbi:MAG: RloB domain-containing protein [Bacteroidota bacterium]